MEIFLRFQDISLYSYSFKYFQRLWSKRFCNIHILRDESLPPFLLPGIFCIKHLNWILKTADLTESSGRLDERPVKNGERDGVNPQTRQSGRLADRPGEDDREKGRFTDRPDRQLSLSCTVLACHTNAYTHASGHLDLQVSNISAMHTYILS